MTTSVTVSETVYDITIAETGINVTATEDTDITLSVADTGPQGPAGEGVPTGGTTGQALTKSSNTNFDTEWATIEGGGGSSTVVPDDVPQQADYWANMLEWSGYLQDYFTAESNPDFKQLYTYYDGEECRYRLRDHFATTTPYYAQADQQNAAYAVYYVEANSGAVPAYWSFTHGLVERYIRRADAQAKTDAISLLEHCAYSTSDAGDPLSTQEYSREVAYNLMNHLQVPRTGYTLSGPQETRRGVLFEYALGHLDAWTGGTATYCRPFMVGLTAYALIQYWELIDEDARILTKLQEVANYIWTTCWLEADGAFQYTDRETGSLDPLDLDPQPDLNMLACPLFGWLWAQTGNQIWRDRGDAIFIGGISVYSGSVHVSGSYLGTRSSSNPAGKQYNQQLYWGPLYIEYAETTVVVSSSSHTHVISDVIGLQSALDTLQTEIDDFGSSLPTGGTSGQLLTKASSTDFDATWEDAPATDIIDFTGSTVLGVNLIVNGGTSSDNAPGARTNLGLAIGTNVQAYDADLSAVAALSSSGIIARTGSGTAAARTVTGTSNEIVVTDGDGVAGNPTLSLHSGVYRASGTDVAVADGGTGSSTAGGARTNLGLGTISTQDASNVTITGGSITGITDLAVADGGTGSSTASGARTNLGLGTIATQDASSVTITGGSVTGITDITVADGGTGSSTASGARGNLGFANSTTDNTVPRFDSTAGQTQSSGVTIDDSNEFYGYIAKFNDQTGTTYSTVNSDAGKVVTLNNASAITVTLHKAAVVGLCCSFTQKGAGQVTFAAESGGSFNNRSSYTKTAGQYAVVSGCVIANSGGSAAQWVLVGDMA